MKLHVSCFLMVGILIFSTFGCVIGSENVTNIYKTKKENVSSNNSVNYSLNTTNTSVIYVDQVRGNDGNSGNQDNPKKSIRSAIDTVAENGTIKIANGQYSGTENSNLIINKSININGQDSSSTIIDGAKNKIWNIIAGKTVSIRGFTFINGINDQGGAISNLGNLNISSCIFKNNIGSVGGAVYNKNNIDITNCYFINNHANQNTGHGGALYTRQGLCKITDTIFHNNTAIGDGGAVNNNYEGYLIIANTQFNSNTARSAGALSNGQNCDIKSCTFKQNTADRMGGAIYSMGNLNVDNSEFTKNTARFDVGGAISTDMADPTSSITIKGTNFNNNHAKSSGAISNFVKLNIENSKFNGNNAEENGGAISNSGTLTVKNSEFTQNKADRYGGAITGLGGFNEIINNSFINNQAVEIGGVLVNFNANIISSNKFINNSANQAGAIYNGFKGDSTHPSSIISDNEFTENMAKDMGGAITNTGAETLSRNNFTMNHVQGNGGGALVSNGTTYLDEGNEFFHNGINEDISGSGSGIINLDGHIYVSGQGNIFKDTNILNLGFLDLKDCVIEKNTEDGNCLNNTYSKGYTESNCKIIKSNHYYQTITQQNYDSYIRNGRHSVGKSAPTHMDNVNPIKVHKGDKVKINPQLWTNSYWPWDVRIDSVDIKFRVYDKNGKYVDVKKTTSWWGYAEIEVDTSNLQPGKYWLLITYDGEDPTNNHIKNPIYASCLRSVSFTVLP